MIILVAPIMTETMVMRAVVTVVVIVMGAGCVVILVVTMKLTPKQEWLRAQPGSHMAWI